MSIIISHVSIQSFLVGSRHSQIPVVQAHRRGLGGVVMSSGGNNIASPLDVCQNGGEPLLHLDGSGGLRSDVVHDTAHAVSNVSKADCGTREGETYPWTSLTILFMTRCRKSHGKLKASAVM